MRVLTAISVFIACVSASAHAFACPACGGNGMPARTISAYLAMTAVLSLAPIAFVLAIGYVLRRAEQGRNDR